MTKTPSKVPPLDSWVQSLQFLDRWKPFWSGCPCHAPVEHKTLLQVGKVGAKAVKARESQGEVDFGQQWTARGHGLQTIQTVVTKHTCIMPYANGQLYQAVTRRKGCDNLNIIDRRRAVAGKKKNLQVFD
jgi:hypothetical protein